MRTSHSVALATLTAFALAAAPAASAEPPAKPPPVVDAKTEADTKVHFQRGVKLYSEEDYRAALVEFKRAYEVSANRAILYNIGQTQFQLREYAAALRSLEEYLRADGPQLPATRRQQVEKDIEDLHGRVAKVTVETNVAGAEIALDDSPLGAAPLAGPVDVSAGVRKFSASKEGYVTVVRSVELAGGDTTKVRLELIAAAPVEVPARPAEVSTSPLPAAQQRGGLSPMVYVGYGVAAAGLAAGTVFGAIALGTKSDLDARCVDRVCPTGERASGDSLTLQATASTVAFGIGVVGIGVGTYFLLTGGKSTSSAGARRVTPWFAGTSAGVGGTF
jgi:PEGA domain